MDQLFSLYGQAEEKQPEYMELTPELVKALGLMGGKPKKQVDYFKREPPPRENAIEPR